MLVIVLVLPFVFGELGGVTTCPAAGLTGLPCPGCGLTRAAIATLHGNPSAALRFHPLIFVVGPTVGLYVTLLGVDAIRPIAWLKRKRAERLISGSALVLAVALFLVWVARFAGAFGGPVATDPWFW